MATTTLPRPTGDLRWRTADQTHLSMPKAAQDYEAYEAAERDRARRNILHGPTRDGCIPACVNPRHEVSPDTCTHTYACVNADHRRPAAHVDQLLDMLGLLPPAEEPEPRTDKQCSTCKEWKPRTEFYRRPKATDGLYSQCKPCHNAHGKRRTKTAKTASPGRIIECESCGETAEHEAHGWCHACYYRWNRAGRPASGPPPAGHKARRLEYWNLTRGQKYTPEAAAKEMGISTRTASRYEIHFKVHGAPTFEQEAA